MISLSIAGLTFHLTLPWVPKPDPAFQPFLGGSGKDYTVSYEPVDALPPVPGKPVYADLICAVYPQGSGFLYVYYLGLNKQTPYAVTTWDASSGRVRVRFLREAQAHVRSFHDCFVCIPLEDMLLSRDRLILHASFLSTAYGGLLFSGPSGIGKSTQARLWQTLEGSTILNGDRPILSRSQGQWFAHGSPYAGSSRYYVRQQRPITAIIMLEQGSACVIRRLEQAEAFQRLYAGTVINVWNSAYVQRVCDLLIDLSASVPVYHLRCTPDVRAVETVKTRLAKGESSNGQTGFFQPNTPDRLSEFESLPGKASPQRHL